MDRGFLPGKACRHAFPDLKIALAGNMFPPREIVDKFIKHFRREDVGVWVCVSPATLDLPQGRVQVTQGARFTLGTTFMNIELAAMLEAEYKRSGTRPA